MTRKSPRPRRKPAGRRRGLAAAIETAMGGTDPGNQGGKPAAPSRAKTVTRKRSAVAPAPAEPIAAAADDTLIRPTPAATKDQTPTAPPPAAKAAPKPADAQPSVGSVDIEQFSRNIAR